MEIDPQLLFQRLLIVATNEFMDLQDLFKYDICSNAVLLTPYRIRSNLNKCHNLANHSMFLVEEHCFIVSFGNTVQPFVTSAAAMCIMLLNDMAGVQYVALGPRVKVIILNILLELKPDGLKFSLKIDLMSLAINAK